MNPFVWNSCVYYQTAIFAVIDYKLPLGIWNNISCNNLVNNCYYKRSIIYCWGFHWRLSCFGWIQLDHKQLEMYDTVVTDGLVVRTTPSVLTQYWLTFYCIALISYRNVAFIVNNIKKWDYSLKKNTSCSLLARIMALCQLCIKPWYSKTCL